jgi:protein-S-isoprenylcysteine O-methyltransferase Ste14
MNRYKEWAKREYSEKQRIIAFIFEGLFFLIIFPFLLIVTSTWIDRCLHLPRFYAGPVNGIFGLLLIAAGLSLGIWSVESQITLGSGTPVPIMPTHKLVIKGPFAYCRNPMTLGTFIAWMGICVWIGSYSAIVIVLVLISCLLLYIKRLEEKELEARFGLEYLEYKRNTPFIIPRLRR